MSGIVAMFHLDGRPAEQATLDRLVSPIRHRAGDGVKLYTQGPLGLAHLHLQTTPTSQNEVQPAGCPQQMAISFDGRLDNREELICALSETSHDSQNLSDAACVLAAYLKFGESFGEHLKGDFAIAIFDAAQQKLILLRDIMGIRPLYYCRTHETFLAASEIKSILAYPGFETRPDDDALADLLLAGDPYERERTCFSGISRVLPGHTVVVTRDKIRSFQHWDFDTTRQIRCASIEEYAERLRVLFQQAVRRRLRSSHPVAVMVSGGLDSSAILCQAELLQRADAATAQPIGISMIFPQGTAAHEKEFVEDIEAYYKIHIQKSPLAQLRFVATENSVWNSELPRFDWNTRSEIFRISGDLGCRVVLDGYYGDQMLANPGYFADLARSFRWKRLASETTEYSRWMADVDPAVIKQDLRWTLWQGLVPHNVVRTFRRHRGITEERQPSWYAPALRACAFRRYVASRPTRQRFVNHHARKCYEFATARPRLNSIETDNKATALQGLAKAYPFMDVDLIQFLMAIPGRVLNWKGVPKGLFREAMKGILPESIRLRNWKADFTALNNQATARDYSKYQQYLGPGCAAVTAGYMDPIGVENRFANQKLDDDNRLPAVQVTTAVALELWLRAFGSGKESNFHPTLFCNDRREIS